MNTARRLTFPRVRRWLTASDCVPKIIAPWIGPLCLIAMFAGVLSGRDRLAFRDVGYFYTPLYQYVAEQCHGQSWGAWGNAIWNPRDQTGMPLAGETTTAVFYPLRMLVYAPSWSAETALGVYVVLHLIIASLTAYHAARRFRCDPWSAAVAGVVYPFSGMVLFLATNPPFLVGAAWMPLLLTPLIDWRTVNAKLVEIGRPVVVPAIAMAMIILGGDPPTALHAMILAVVVQGAWLATGYWRRTSPLREQLRTVMAIVVQMAVIVALASVLAAPQIAASLAWSARSDRVQHASTPGTPGTPKVHDQAYAFSVPPWRLAELLAPNLYGSPWPVNTRWDRLMFDDGRTRPETALWTPSLYSGLLLPVLLVLGWTRGRLFSLTRFSRHGWALLIVFVLSMAAALGAYGPVYRWLHEFVPGYDSLRYPAKWLPFAAFSLAIGCAMLVRRHRVAWCRENRKPTENIPVNRSRKLASTLALVGLIVASGWTAAVISRMRGRVSDPFWGPFVPELAHWQFLFSMACVAVVVTMIVSIRRPWWWLVWVAIDLCVAHHQLVPRIDRAAELRLLAGEQHDTSSLRWMRVIEDGSFPTQWSEHSDRDRMLTVEAGLRLARFGRWHLEHDDAVVNNIVSIGSYELAEFWHFAKSIDAADGLLPEHHWRSWCRLLGVGGLLRCRGGNVAVSAATSHRALPVVTQERLGAANDILPNQLSIRTRVEAIVPDRAVAWRTLLEAYAGERADVAARVPPAIAREVSRRGATGDSCTVVSRRVYQDGNWRAMLTPLDRNAPAMSAEVFPVDFLSQGVLCPPGRWRIEFFYAPWWHRPMLLLAAIGWSSVVTGYLLRRTRIATHRQSPLDTHHR